MQGRRYDIRRAAKRLGLTPKVLRNAIRRRRLPASRVGHRLYVASEDLAQYRHIGKSEALKRSWARGLRSGTPHSLRSRMKLIQAWARDPKRRREQSEWARKRALGRKHSAESRQRISEGVHRARSGEGRAQVRKDLAAKVAMETEQARLDGLEKGRATRTRQATAKKNLRLVVGDVRLQSRQLHRSQGSAPFAICPMREPREFRERIQTAADLYAGRGSDDDQ
jgi:hypothetical protein